VRIGRQDAVRLTVHRTNQHIYAQVIDAAGGKVLASASTLEKDVRASFPNGAKKEAAAEVGKRIARRRRRPASPRWPSTARDSATTAA
jgi:large subunit ribosomal protein L18